MSTFGWCTQNKHKECVRVYEKFYIDLKTNKPVMSGDMVNCECPKRGCECYVKRADRTKTPRRVRR